MNRLRISVVMIVRNEAPRVLSCLRSLESLGDHLHEVCVYDTGSTDGTVAIARGQGAIVHEGYWDDDFARARNAAADMASGDWLFVIDADERLTCDDKELGRILGQAAREPDGFYIAAEADARQVQASNTWMSARLYQPARLHYVRPVHTALERLDGSGPVLWSIPEEVVLLHNLGFDPSRMKQSLALKERLTTALITQTPKGAVDRFALTDRGRARLGQGRYEDAIGDLWAADAVPYVHASSYVAWAKELLIEGLLRVGRPQDAQPVLQSLERLQPGRRYTRWLRGRLHMAEGRHAEGFREFACLDGAVDAGFSPLEGAALYRACLDCAVEEASVTHIIASLVALVGLRGGTESYGALLARWWGDLPAEALIQILAVSTPRSPREIADGLSNAGGLAAHLGARLRAAMSAGPGQPRRPATNAIASVQAQNWEPDRADARGDAQPSELDAEDRILL